MRGSPLLQTIFIAVVFALAGLPVWRLTRSAADAAPVQQSTVVAAAVPLEVEADFAPAPADFLIKNLDQPVLSGRGPQARFTSRWDARVPAEGVDLVIQAHWPEGAAPSAARVIVRFPDGRSAEKSVWAGANGSLTEVFTVPGNAP